MLRQAAVVPMTVGSCEPQPLLRHPNLPQQPWEQTSFPLASTPPWRQKPGITGEAVSLSCTLLFCTALCVQVPVKSHFCWETLAKQNGFIL